MASAGGGSMVYPVFVLFFMVLQMMAVGTFNAKVQSDFGSLSTVFNSGGPPPTPPAVSCGWNVFCVFGNTWDAISYGVVTVQFYAGKIFAVFTGISLMLADVTGGIVTFNPYLGIINVVLIATAVVVTLKGFV